MVFKRWRSCAFKLARGIPSAYDMIRGEPFISTKSWHMQETTSRRDLTLDKQVLHEIGQGSIQLSINY